ncbi:MAG: hypothetical protein DMF84_15495 [Acidobacteria bacterium]|nr:MAG: hypothetical protein DMF84_15495 [Acidobacteriota bacterium]
MDAAQRPAVAANRGARGTHDDDLRKGHNLRMISTDDRLRGRPGERLPDFRIRNPRNQIGMMGCAGNLTSYGQLGTNKRLGELGTSSALWLSCGISWCPVSSTRFFHSRRLSTVRFLCGLVRASGSRFMRRMETMRLRTLAAVLAAVLLAWPAAAQEQRGSIQGIVKDASGGVLPGATVEARSAGSGVLSAVADAGGNFRFPSVLPGTYEVKATLSGFKPAKVPSTCNSPPSPKR